MADAIDIKIEIENELLKIIQWLQSYKNAADEALTHFTSRDMPDDYLREGQKIALRALNIGAHEQSGLSTGWGEQDVIVRLFLKAWRQEDFETWDKLPDWIEMDNEQFRDVLHRFAILVTERNSKPATNNES